MEPAALLLIVALVGAAAFVATRRRKQKPRDLPISNAGVNIPEEPEPPETTETESAPGRERIVLDYGRDDLFELPRGADLVVRGPGVNRYIYGGDPDAVIAAEGGARAYIIRDEVEFKGLVNRTGGKVLWRNRSETPGAAPLDPEIPEELPAQDPEAPRHKHFRMRAWGTEDPRSHQDYGLEIGTAWEYGIDYSYRDGGWARVANPAKLAGLKARFPLDNSFCEVRLKSGPVGKFPPHMLAGSEDAWSMADLNLYASGLEDAARRVARGFADAGLSCFVDWGFVLEKHPRGPALLQAVKLGMLEGNPDAKLMVNVNDQTLPKVFGICDLLDREQPQPEQEGQDRRDPGLIEKYSRLAREAWTTRPGSVVRVSTSVLDVAREWDERLRRILRESGGKGFFQINRLSGHHETHIFEGGEWIKT